MPKILVKLRDIAPGIDIEILATNAVSDLMRREADIAVRHFRSTQPDLIAKKLKEIPAWLYAAPAYLDRIGRPATPDDLSRATFVGFGGSDWMITGLNALGFNLSQKKISDRYRKASWCAGKWSSRDWAWASSPRTSEGQNLSC